MLPYVLYEGENMNFEECMEFIASYSRLGGRVTDLSRARELMERIGNPEKKLKFIHIAGTNGKGSTLEYIANALVYTGYKTGKFTSPYVTHYTDRIRINDREIDEKSLGEICRFVAENVADRKYSQFEITMAIAMLWYVREQCDIVVLETGIGGLLDSTNVIPPPLLSVITSVSFDHRDILGAGLKDIAKQKAGIIKSNSAVVLAKDNVPMTAEIVKSFAEEKGAELIELENCIPYADGGIISPFIYKKEKYVPAMLGIHQFYNAQTAVTACVYLRSKDFDIPDEAIKKSIETTSVKARQQYIDGEPPVIVDGAHNISGIGVLINVLRYLSTRNKKIYTVTGMVDSKDYIQCIKNISPYIDKLFAVDDFAENCVSAENITDIAGFYTAAEGCGSLSEAVEKAKALALENNGIVVICGSLYLASEYLNKYAE